MQNPPKSEVIPSESLKIIKHPSFRHLCDELSSRFLQFAARVCVARISKLPPRHAMKKGGCFIDSFVCPCGEDKENGKTPLLVSFHAQPKAMKSTSEAIKRGRERNIKIVFSHIFQ